MKSSILPYVATLMGIVLSLACGKGDSSPETTNPRPPTENGRDFKVIHVYVALCDNESQGIAPVPAKIGNGNDPANNLYWGCTDGARSYFKKSKLWNRLAVEKVKSHPAILERLVFQHKKTRSLLVIDAWRGSEIEPCLRQFRQSMSGQHYESFSITDKKGVHQINLGGGADFLAFIGHNGLMEFSLPSLDANPHRVQSVDVAVLCCKSNRFFAKHIIPAKVRPVVMTDSNMYPGAFILHDALEGWFCKESLKKIRLRAAKAYAKNQKISTKSALNVFSKLP